MVPGRLSGKVVVERIRWIRKMVLQIRSLPLESYDRFIAEPTIAAAAESYLRRGIESLMDLGRHILAKGFAKAPAEYKSIARDLNEVGILTIDQAEVMREIAGYRNRLVHFYDEVTETELYKICTEELGAIERLVEIFENWIKEHPDKIDRTL